MTSINMMDVQITLLPPGERLTYLLRLSIQEGEQRENKEKEEVSGAHKSGVTTKQN
jgi:hypothetical protein